MKGFYWHVHHDILLEYCWDYEERKRYIKIWKSTNEIATRLKLFKPVEGTLPEELVKAGKAYEEARKAWIAAWKGLGGDCEKVGKIFDKKLKVYVEAVSNNQEYLEQLHTKECPNCPWNGEEIVFEK